MYPIPFQPSHQRVYSESSGGSPYSPAPKPKRKKITADQFKALSEMFDVSSSPSYDVREALGIHLGMSNREVQV